MSSIRLNTSDDIVTFLKILAEESVAVARSEIAADPLQASFEGMLKRDEKTYGPLDEVEEEDVEVEDETEVEVEEEAPSLEVSLDSLTDAVKQLRSGRSVDDSRIRDQLRAYFDRLDELEKQALLAFMRSFGGILTGELQGGDAPDPSDEPWSINMSKTSEETEEVEAEETEEELPGPGEEEEETGEVEEEEEEEEDTTPPIKAGGGQELAEIRRRVQSLMSR